MAVLEHRLFDPWPPIPIAVVFCPRRSDSGPGKAAENPAPVGLCVGPREEHAARAVFDLAFLPGV